jgi:hypothetical protein
MGIIGSSVYQTDPVKWAANVDEEKYKNNIVPFGELLTILQANYTNPVDNSVKKTLEKEHVYAMNFQLKIEECWDIYGTGRWYTIMGITNFHKHCGKKGEKYGMFELERYTRLLETSAVWLPQCKCILSVRQLLLYNHLRGVLFSTSSNLSK